MERGHAAGPGADAMAAAFRARENEGSDAGATARRAAGSGRNRALPRPFRPDGAAGTTPARGGGRGDPRRLHRRTAADGGGVAAVAERNHNDPTSQAGDEARTRRAR